MRKRKKVKLLDVQAVKSMKLGWRVRRQVQQELLQKKLAERFLEHGERQAWIERYPEAMQPMIRGFLQEAEKQTRLRRR